MSDFPVGTDEAKVKSIFGAYGNIKTCQMLSGQNGALIHFMSSEEASWIVENLNGNIAQGLTTPVSCRFSTPQDNGKGAAAASWGAKSERHEPYGGKGGGWSGGKETTDVGGKGTVCGKWQPSFGGGKSGSWQGGGKDTGGKCSVQTLKKGLQYAGVLPGGKWSNDENSLYVGGLPSDTTDLDMYEIFSCFGAIPTKGVRAMPAEDGNCKGFGFVNFLYPESATNAIKILNGTMLPDGTTLKVMPKGQPRNKGK